MPRVLPENETAFRVWEYCQGQVVTAGMGEVIDIDFGAVRIACEVMKVRDPDGVFLKVVEIGRAVIAAGREKK